MGYVVVPHQENIESLVYLLFQEPRYPCAKIQLILQPWTFTLPLWKVSADNKQIAKASANYPAFLIKFLDTIRPMLEEISPVLGVTDPVSGPVVAER